MNQGVLEQAQDVWILEYGKFIVSLLLIFQHQRELLFLQTKQSEVKEFKQKLVWRDSVF